MKYIIGIKKLYEKLFVISHYCHSVESSTDSDSHNEVHNINNNNNKKFKKE